MEDTKYLYHYTSIQTLALILKNRNIRFNNLLNVDDPEEAETGDIGKAGRHCLVSCWTNNSEDVIPMWNMYTPGMKGVRIKMRQYPFKKYTYKKGELHFTEQTDSYVNYYADYINKVSIAPGNPMLIKVEYTDAEEFTKPQIIKNTDDGMLLNVDNIGKYKRTHWQFQAEYRYRINTAPWTLAEMEKVREPEECVGLFKRFLDKESIIYCDEIFLDLADNAFEGMEILLAPKTSDAEYIIVEALLDKYCKGRNVKLEKSKIKVR